MRPHWRRLLALAGLLAFCLPLARALAAPTDAPNQSEAGPEERRFRRKTKPAIPPSRPPVSIENKTTPAPPPAAAPAQTITVKEIRVEGSRLIPLGEVRRLVAPYEGRTVAVSDLQQLATVLTQWLRGHGYVTSRAYLPLQEVTSGLVTIQILEGHVGAVRVEGARYIRPATLLHRMQTRPGVLLDYVTLQRDLARLGANPDRRATGVLLPGASTGTTDVVVKVEERSPWHLAGLADNAGTKFTGRHRQGATLGDNNLTGHDDQLVVRTEVSDRTDFVGTTANYLLPLGPSGRTLEVQASYADVSLSQQFRPLGITGTSAVLETTWAEPLWQTRHWEVEWATGVSSKRIRTRESGSARGKDDLRVLQFGPNALEEDAIGRSILTSEVGIGLSRFLGSSRNVDPSATRSQTGGKFVRLTMGGGRLQHLWGDWQFVARGSWQWTNDRLPPSEMLRLGGEETVRGYPEGEFLGDYGCTGTLELRTPVPVPHHGPRSPLTAIVFLDGGAGFLRKPLQTEEQKKRLTGVGFGFRWTLSPYTQALLDIGFPVGDTSVEKDTPRLYYAVSIGF